MPKTDDTPKKYIIVSTAERNSVLLTDDNENQIFTDKNLAKQKLFEDFAKMFKDKTGDTLTYDEFLDIGDYGDYDYGVDQFGENAWINDIYGQNYDVNLFEIK